MNVFITWSGDLSKAVATALHEWLPDVIQGVHPFMSEEDIRKGQRWAIELAKNLESTDHGICCLTHENITAPWVLYEAGALSKAVEESYLWTILIGDLKHSDVTGPLSQFHHTTTQKEDIKRLLESINEAAGNDQLDRNRLDRLFEDTWHRFEKKLQQAEADFASGDTSLQQRSRPPEELLDEVLDLSRTMSKTLHMIASGQLASWPAVAVYEAYRITILSSEEAVRDFVRTITRRFPTHKTEVFYDEKAKSWEVIFSFDRPVPVGQILGIGWYMNIYLESVEPTSTPSMSHWLAQRGEDRP